MLAVTDAEAIERVPVRLKTADLFQELFSNCFDSVHKKKAHYFIFFVKVYAS